MLRFGAAPENACEMDLDHIFISRLKLLIVMTRAYLEGYPFGTVRKSALVGNAQYIAAESVDLEQLIPIRREQPTKDGMDFDHVFYQRVKLLASMAKTIGMNPNVAKAGGFQSQGVEGDAVVLYCNSLATRDLESSRFPEREKT